MDEEKLTLESLAKMVEQSSGIPCEVRNENEAGTLGRLNGVPLMTVGNELYAIDPSFFTPGFLSNDFEPNIELIGDREQSKRDEFLWRARHEMSPRIVPHAFIQIDLSEPKPRPNALTWREVRQQRRKHRRFIAQRVKWIYWHWRSDKRRRK